MAKSKETADKVKEEAQGSDLSAQAVAAAEEEQSIITEKRTTDAVNDATGTAKAGKRSAKALREQEDAQAKADRKETGESDEDKPRQIAKPTRSRLERQGKNFRKASEQVEKGKAYTLTDALELAQKTSPVKFDATVEMHINLGVDPRHADQNIRDNLVLPAGTGKAVRVAVLSDDTVEGADISGVETILKDLDKGTINFDILIATPANMAKLGKYARVLGPRGLMPNPKSGTVTTDVATAVTQAKAGRVEYRVDSTGIVHLGLGKVSFTASQLQDNANAILASIKGNKPASVKSNYLKAVHITTTMGPSITVDLSSIA